MRIFLAAILYSSCCSFSANASPVSSDSRFLTDFIQQQTIDEWQVVNDGVMGGRSTGNIINEQQHMVFKGSISIENNGGFSSVFRPVKNLPKNTKDIIIDTLGDGQKYQLRVRVYIEGYRVTYKHEFTTIAGQRQRFNLPLDDFEATFRGRKVTNAPALKSQDINEIGLLMTKKQAGDFKLSVFHLMI
jgi:hypothetical protein